MSMRLKDHLLLKLPGFRAKGLFRKRARFDGKAALADGIFIVGGIALEVGATYVGGRMKRWLEQRNERSAREAAKDVENAARRRSEAA